MDGTREMVMVPVPAEHLPAVYELLGRLMAPAAPGDQAASATCPHCGAEAFATGAGGYQCGDCGVVFRDPGTIEVDHENGCWTERMVHRLHAELTSEVVRRALDIVAECAPDAVGYEELVQRLDVGPAQLRSELAALSKASRRLFGRKVWPMTARQGLGDGSRTGYRMPERVSAWWRSARLAAGE